MTGRQFPDNPHPFPAVIAGRHVMAALRLPVSMGEVPDVAVMIGRDSDLPQDRAFVVWDAAVRDGAWSAYSGKHDLSWSAAVREFGRRALQG